MMPPACLIDNEAPPSRIAAGPPVGGQVERTAFYLQSEGRPLFAWLHQVPGGTMGHGVLICPPLGHEHVHLHRSLRHLGDMLAVQGFTVLRLDYHGTGDSDGTDLDAHRCATWQANIRDAADWLKEEGGCREVSLIGLRMGATLAMLHACHHDVASLVLWAPVVKGRRYVRELKALSQTARHAAEAGSPSIEAVGFVFTQETAQDLSALDLLALNPRFQNGLIVQSDQGANDTLLLDHLAKQEGGRIEQLMLPGYEEMMAEPHETAVPHSALLRITQWLRSKTTAPEAWEYQGATPVPDFPASMLTNGQAPVRESIHCISAAPALFGIVTEPTESSASLPWIVILNAGAAYRVGPGRLHVQLARQLAVLGYPCLRMDISGLGDSVAGSGQVENDTYAATAFRDIAIACDYLQSLQSGRPIVLMGLCSGAYAAFQSAAQLPHPALVESILINPLTFFWREGMSIQSSPDEHLHALNYYRNILFDLDNWRKLFSGKTNAGISGALRRFIRRMVPRPVPKAAPAAQSPASTTPYEYSHPAKEDLSADLDRVVAAGRSLAMFISEDDPGLFLLKYKARRKSGQLLRSGRLRCFAIQKADHTFSTEAARQALSRSLTSYLGQRFDSPSSET